MEVASNKEEMTQHPLNDGVAFEVLSGLNFNPMVERKFEGFQEGDSEGSRIMWKEHWKLEECNL